MKKYWVIFKSCIAKSIEYRSMLGLWLLVELIGLSAAIFLWFAVFRTNETVGIYSYSQMISYYILLPLIGGITSSYLVENLPRRIKDGLLSTELTKPYSIAGYNLVDQLAFKFTHLTIKLPVYLGIIVFFVHFFGIEFKPVPLLLAFAVGMLAYLLNFAMDLVLSYTSFWFDDVWFLGHLKSACLLIFGGMSFPLDLVPEKYQLILNIMPFRLIYYFPVKVAQGSLTPDVFWREIMVLVLWIAWFLVISKVIWKLGVKQYGAYGN